METLKLIKAPDIVAGEILLTDEEPISGNTFNKILEENEGNLIIARVQTRDKRDFRKKYFHYFYGPNLIKILFSTFNTILRSRYHNEFPISSKNPLTNNAIVGEVEFYSYKAGDSHAAYFGSDFNYANQKAFRDKFISLTNEKNLCNIGLREEQPQPAIDGQAQQPLLEPQHPLNADQVSYQEFMNHLQHQASLGFDVPMTLRRLLQFKARSLDFFGRMIAFFALASAMTIYNAVKNFVYASNPSHSVELDLFTYLLPFVSFIMDASIKRAYCVQAKNAYIIFKILFIFYYLALYVCALQATPDVPFYWVVCANLLMFPALMSVYTWALMKGKLSKMPSAMPNNA